ADGILRIWQEHAGESQVSREKARVLRVVLGQLPRLGEAFSQKFLAQVIPVYDALQDQASNPDVDMLLTEMLEQGLFVAAHYDLNAYLAPLVDRFLKRLGMPGNHGDQESFDAAAAACLRSLRRMGMRHEIEILLKSLADRVLLGRAVASLTAAGIADKPR